MSKHILFFADGTWNGPSEGLEDDVAAMVGNTEGGDFTNVLKLYVNLAGHATDESTGLKDEQEKILFDANRRPVQIAKYLHGVGDSRNPIVKVLGGALGSGMTARIVRGYTFLSRHYDPGDRIHIIGFSRGAYTARALAGMIASVGLLDRTRFDPEDKVEAYKRGAAAWSKSKQACLRNGGIFTEWANAFLQFAQGIHARDLKDKDLIPDVAIESVAVWDTVGALGVPRFKQDQRIDILQFTDLSLSNKVKYGFHAMALDEQRRDFPVTRWDPRAGIEQVWFAGAHSDVGGGYPRQECGLSDVALDWMMAKLGALGVKYSDPLPYLSKPDAVQCAIHLSHTRPPFHVLPPAARTVVASDVLHSSVDARWHAATAPAYRPGPLSQFQGAPRCFTIVGTD